MLLLEYLLDTGNRLAGICECRRISASIHIVVVGVPINEKQKGLALLQFAKTTGIAFIVNPNGRCLRAMEGLLNLEPIHEAWGMVVGRWFCELGIASVIEEILRADNFADEHQIATEKLVADRWWRRIGTMRAGTRGQHDKQNEERR